MMNNKTNTEELITKNRRYVEAVAKQYLNQGLTQEQLIEEGNKGLVKAANSFDESKGFKFMAYAVWWIRKSILEALAAAQHGEAIPNGNALSARERGILRAITDGESLEQIAEERRLTLERVRQIRELALRKLNQTKNKNQNNE